MGGMEATGVVLKSGWATLLLCQYRGLGYSKLRKREKQTGHILRCGHGSVRGAKRRYMCQSCVGGERKGGKVG